MILLGLPSSSCCAGSSCTAWRMPPLVHCCAIPSRAVVDDLVAQGAPAFVAATPMLSQLLKAEMAEREVRSIACHTKVARFSSYKDLTGFDFASSDINEATVRPRHRGEFIHCPAGDCAAICRGVKAVSIRYHLVN